MQECDERLVIGLPGTSEAGEKSGARNLSLLDKDKWNIERRAWKM